MVEFTSLASFLCSQTLKRHVVKIKTLCHASESWDPNSYRVFTGFSGYHLGALRALAGMKKIKMVGTARAALLCPPY
jgi:hypothetical protein